MQHHMPMTSSVHIPENPPPCFKRIRDEIPANANAAAHEFHSWPHHKSEPAKEDNLWPVLPELYPVFLRRYTHRKDNQVFVLLHKKRPLCQFTPRIIGRQFPIRR